MFAPRVKWKIYLYDLHKDSLYESYTLCSVGRHNETRNEMNKIVTSLESVGEIE